MRIEDAASQVNNCWNNLDPLEQQNPIIKAKYERANQLLDKTSNLLTRLDGALSTASTSSVQYSLDKNLKNM